MIRAILLVAVLGGCGSVLEDEVEAVTDNTSTATFGGLSCTGLCTMVWGSRERNPNVTPSMPN